jgi:hypothetical protein
MEDQVRLYLSELIKDESKIKEIIYAVNNYRIDSGYRDMEEAKRCKRAFIRGIAFALKSLNNE